MGERRRLEPLARRDFLKLGAAAALACGRGDKGGGAPEDSASPDPPAAAAPARPLPPATPRAPARRHFWRAPSGWGWPAATQSDRVILWTRLVVSATDVAATPDQAVDLVWELAEDAAFSQGLRRGLVSTDASVAHSVHLDVDGLSPDTVYYYRFVVGDFESPTGRTKTLPCADAVVQRLRLGFATCQNWLVGWYAPYRDMADQQLDLIVFLGDYIYESGVSGPVRDHGAEEPTTLDEYRDRHGLYRSDPDLQAAHASAPWVLIQDDHEVKNNYAGGPWAEDPERAARMAAAYRAWWEHMPVRAPAPDGGPLQVAGSLRFGSLAQVLLLDGRQFREAQPCGDQIGARCPETDDERAFLGATQEDALARAVAEAACAWVLVANPVVMLPMDLGGSFLNPDQWDGYPQARQRFLDAMAENAVGDVILFSGDIHSSGHGAVPQDPFDVQSPPVISEIVVTPISSHVSDERFALAAALLPAQPHIGFWDVERKGWVEAEIEADRVTVRFRWSTDPTDPAAELSVGHSAVILPGAPLPQPL